MSYQENMFRVYILLILGILNPFSKHLLTAVQQKGGNSI